MAHANLALRFLLELAAIVAVAYWGYAIGTDIWRWILAVVAPLGLIAIWAVLIAPKASNPIPQDARVVLGSVVLLVAAGLLALAGQPMAAAVLAGLVVLNTIGMFVLGHRPPVS